MAATKVQNSRYLETSSSATSVSLTLGATPTANNLLVAHIVTGVGGAITTPSGWTRIEDGSVTSGTIGVCSAFFYKVADGSETTTTVSYSNASSASLAIAEYSGLDSTAPFDASAESDVASSTSAAIGSVAPTSAPGLAFAVLGYRTGSSPPFVTNPSGFSTVQFQTGSSFTPTLRTASYDYTNTDTIAATFSISSSVSRWAALALFKEAAGGGATTVTADVGAFTLTGQAAGLLAHRTLTAQSGSFTHTGNAAGLLAARKVTANAGSFAHTGQAANLTAARILPAAAGAYTLTGSDATLTKTTVGAFTLTAESGALALTGNAAGLIAARKVTADAGSFALTGNAATLTKTTAGAYSLTCAVASFALTGSAAGLIATRTLQAAAGSFSLTGSAAGIAYGRAVVAEPGAFTLTGSDATLTATIAARLTAEPGVFALTGADAVLTYSGVPVLAAARSVGRQLQSSRRSNIQTSRR